MGFGIIGLEAYNALTARSHLSPWHEISPSVAKEDETKVHKAVMPGCGGRSGSPTDRV